MTTFKNVPTNNVPNVSQGKKKGGGWELVKLEYPAHLILVFGWGRGWALVEIRTLDYYIKKTVKPNMTFSQFHVLLLSYVFITPSTVPPPSAPFGDFSLESSMASLHVWET
jgi:hypothetical protein